jgi:arylsulfatase A-like enzyme
MRFLLLLSFILAGTGLAADRPNVVFIFVDDMGWGDASCYGGKFPTPNIDRLAREGTLFRQFYVASPICSPSRCGVITGQFPARWRINSYLQTKAGHRECEQADFLDPQAPSMPRAFKVAGYATAHIGKWHLGGGRDVTEAPKFAAYGYDLGLGTYESPEPAAALGLKTTPWEKKREPQQVARHDRTRWMVDQTVEFLKTNRDRPCFVNLWFDDVHTPYVPSDEQLAELPEGPGTVQYRAVLRDTDQQVGRLLDALRDLEIEPNTLVMLAGDNGPQPSFERARTGGLRGMKWSLYEGGIRTPFIVRLPGVVPANVVNDTSVVCAVDFLPTLCRMAGIPAPDAAFDGEDLSAVFRGARTPRSKPLFWEYGRKPGEAGKVKGGFPYPNEPDSKSPNIAVRDGDWKLLVHADGTQAELYHLARDPNESKNLAASEKETAKRLQKAALEWRRTLP